MLHKFTEKQGIEVPKTFDRIPWKHQQAPPLSSRVPSDFRALYVFSDPRDAALSIFRRNIQHFHLARMGEMRRKFGIPVAEPTCGPDSLELEDFLNRGADLFGFENQFRRWTTADRQYPIMILKFEALWEHLPEFFAFVGLPSQGISDFPEYFERHSDWRDLESEKKEKLNQIYEDVAQRVESRPELVIR
jgi:hypothetical protein